MENSRTNAFFSSLAFLGSYKDEYLLYTYRCTIESHAILWCIWHPFTGVPATWKPRKEDVLSEDLLEDVLGFFNFGQWTKAVPETMTRNQPCPSEFMFVTTSSHFLATGLRRLSSSQDRLVCTQWRHFSQHELRVY